MGTYNSLLAVESLRSHLVPRSRSVSPSRSISPALRSYWVVMKVSDAPMSLGIRRHLKLCTPLFVLCHDRITSSPPLQMSDNYTPQKLCSVLNVLKSCFLNHCFAQTKSLLPLIPALPSPIHPVPITVKSYTAAILFMGELMVRRLQLPEGLGSDTTIPGDNIRLRPC